MLTIGRLSWRAVLWLGGVTIFLLPFIHRHLPESRVFSQEGGAGRSFLRIGRTRNHVMFWLAYFMTLLMIYGLGTWLPELMLRGGVNMASSLSLLVILNIGCILGTFALATIADKWVNPRKLLITLYMAGAVSLGLLGLPHSLAALCAIIFIVGACTYGAQNIANAYVSQYYPPDVRSSGLGWCNGIGRLGAIFGASFWGFMLEWPLSVQAIFLIFAVPALTAATAFFFARDD
jgi:AAHS family benzoate transporter-like MFS transporter